MAPKYMNPKNKKPKYMNPKAKLPNYKTPKRAMLPVASKIRALKKPATTRQAPNQLLPKDRKRPAASSSHAQKKLATSGPAHPPPLQALKPAAHPPLKAPEGGLTVATWNIAAINNNPFEYWITHNDIEYTHLMEGVEAFIENPGERDVAICQVFNDDKFADLMTCMKAEGWQGLDIVERSWQDDYRSRKIISGFMKDKSIGSKRLASMPDRITNTISIAGGRTVCRPTVINNYNGNLASVETWWPQWRDFMFNNVLQVEAKGKVSNQKPCQMLSKISRAKYPALSEEEEAISLPLQCLCQAIFDVILVHIMVTLSPEGRWQKIKASIVEAIYSKKHVNTLQILHGACNGVDVICLQEAAASFKDTLEKELGGKYFVCLPQVSDPKRDQNSIILLSKAIFLPGCQEVTALALEELGAGAAVETGDLLAIKAQTSLGQEFLIASFHGDTNGLATKPVVSAISKLLARQQAGCRVIFGLDANVYLKKKEGLQDVTDFLSHCDTLGLRTCWTSKDLSTCFTCCNARTFLQPQLNKAIRSSEKLTKGDINPKDHVLLQSDVYDVVACYKDNTGKREYVESSCFPTLNFPSDHGLVSVVLSKKSCTTPMEL